MPTYLYKAKGSGGLERKGEHQAKNKVELARFLRRQGLLLISADEISASAKKEQGFSLKNMRIPGFGSGVSVSDKMMFSRNLAVMLEAGVPITKALSTLAIQGKSTVLQGALKDIGLRISKGSSLSEALKAYQNIFGPLYVNMIAAGEASGTVNDALKILAQQLKNDHELRSRVRGALVYPAVIIVAMGAIGALMLVFVIPSLQEVFDDLDADLPITTKIILNSGSIFISYWWAIIGGMVAGAYGFFWAIKTKTGGYVYNAFIIRAPVLGGIARKVYTARFARTLSSLIKGGVPILEALDIVGKIMGNRLFAESIEKASEGVRKGKPLHEMLAPYSHLYTPLIIQMLQVGEETGKLSDVLERLAVFYEDEVAQVTKNLSSIIEPILMLVIGAGVGFFAVSMIQPIYNVIGTL